MKKLALSLAVVFLFSCGKKEDQGNIPVVEINGIPVVQNPDEPLWKSCPWHYEEEFAFSNENTAPETSFIYIWDLVVDDGGKMYVLDARQKLVQVFNERGRFLRSIGASGEGPGEFLFPASIEMDANGHLLVYDSRLRRISWFETSGSFVKDFTLEKTAFPRRVFYWDSGHFLMMAYSFRKDEPNSRYYLMAFVDTTGMQTDSLTVLYGGPRRVLQLDGGMVLSYASEYDPDLFWVVIPGSRIYVGYGEKYSISVFDQSGRLVRRITRQWEPKKIPEEKRRKIRQQFRNVPEDVKAKMEIPDVEPAFYGLSCDDLGYLWVKRTIRSPYRFDIFDETGRFVCQIVLAVDPLFWKDGRLYGRRVDDERGVVELVRLKRIETR